MDDAEERALDRDERRAREQAGPQGISLTNRRNTMATRRSTAAAPAPEQPSLPVAPPVTGPDNDATALRCGVVHPQLGPCTRLDHPPDERHDNGRGVQWGGPPVTVMEEGKITSVAVIGNV
jgi:hypothetical protein